MDARQDFAFAGDTDTQRSATVGRVPLRQDIQILRGFAVLLVVAYHLRPDLIPSGFLGVDIFFVLSGYLMGLLYDPANGREALDFLVRRGRRILPAYFVVLLACLVVATLMTLPHELAIISGHAWHAASMMPNVGFWLDTSYFESTEFKPFLHFWSLGVEAQFYVLFPVVAWAFRKARWTIPLAIGLSLLACVVVASVSPKTSFFMLPFRLWEFLAGFLAAKVAARHLLTLQPARTVFFVTALALMVAISFLEVTEAQHPGLAAVAITALTIALLVVGLPNATAGSGLWRLPALLGTYSYSIYLVHFPVIAFMAYRPFEGTVPQLLSWPAMVGALAFTVVLSVSLYHLVEQPGRRMARPHFYAGMGLALAASVCAAVFLPMVQRASFNDHHLKILSATSDRSEYRCGKWARILHPTDASCELVAGKPRYLLVGNSHADAIKEALSEAARSTGAGLRMMVSNCSVSSSGPCGLPSILSEIETHGIEGLIIHSSASGVDPAAIGEVVRGLPGDVRAIFLSPIPVWNASVPQALYEGAPELVQNIDDYRARTGTVVSAVAAAGGPRMELIESGPAFCDPVCSVVDHAGRPLYFDDSHLTLAGGRRLVPALVPIFEEGTPREISRVTAP